MQIVYISNRPEMLHETLAYVRAFMSFLDDIIVFCPRTEIDAFQALDSTIRVFDEAHLLGPEAEAFRQSSDHQRKNYILRSRLAYFPEVAGEFIMSDDDSRPLRPIREEYFKSHGKHQPFFFYVLEKWEGILDDRVTSYDLGNINTYKVLKAAGLGTVSYGSHMPQIMDRELLRASVEFFRPALQKYGSITEWETYFNFAIDRRPERFHMPRPFTVLGWPDKPHWPWFVEPRSFDFENFYSEAYEEGGLFAGLSPKFDEATHTDTTAEKVRRYSSYFANEWRRRREGAARDERRYQRRLSQRLLRLVRARFSDVSRLPRPLPVAGVTAPHCPIEVVGLFGFTTGLGNAAAMLAHTLEQCAPAGAITQLDVSSFFEDARGRKPNRAPIPRAEARSLVVCLNPLQGQQYLRQLPRRRLSRKRIVGYWWWEFPSFPERWVPCIEDFDEVWVSSRFIFDNWRATLGPRLRWVPLDLRPRDPPPAVASRTQSEPLRMLSIFNLGSTIERKNPLAVVEVVRKLRERFGLGVSLTLKVGGLARHPDRYVEFQSRLGATEEGITVIVGDLPEDKLRRLIADHDMYVSLHRAEGLGIPLAQAMAAGKIVVATGWSGNLNVMDDQSAVLVDYAMTEITDENHNTEQRLICVEPDIDDAVAKIGALIEHRERFQTLRERARAKIETVSEAALRQVRADLFP